MCVIEISIECLPYSASSFSAVTLHLKKKKKTPDFHLGFVNKYFLCSVGRDAIKMLSSAVPLILA